MACGQLSLIPFGSRRPSNVAHRTTTLTATVINIHVVAKSTIIRGTFRPRGPGTWQRTGGVARASQRRARCVLDRDHGVVTMSTQAGRNRMTSRGPTVTLIPSRPRLDGVGRASDFHDHFGGERARYSSRHPNAARCRPRLRQGTCGSAGPVGASLTSGCFARPRNVSQGAARRSQDRNHTPLWDAPSALSENSRSIRTSVTAIAKQRP